MPDDFFSQCDHRIRLEWGWRGAERAASRGDAVVIVDVLRFSTTVITAASRGIVTTPARDGKSSIEDALKPATYESISSGADVRIVSPNGATCTQLAQRAPEVLIGALVNARAVAGVISELTTNVTVVACGERWHDESPDGALRFAIEDYLGAGAILSHLDASQLSPEAQLAASAFRASRENLSELLLNCGSGRELLARDDRDSVERAATLDRFDVVPVLQPDGTLLAQSVTTPPR